MENEKKSLMLKLADKIVEWDKKIGDLTHQGNEAAIVVKEDYAKTSEELKKKKLEAEEKLKQLKSVGSEGWEELKTSAELAISDLSQAVDKALSKFKKQS